MPPLTGKTAGQRPDAPTSRPVRSPDRAPHDTAATSPGLLRAALYGRVSDNRHAGDSVDEQDLDNTAACTTQAWAVAGRYSDELSASRFGRKIRADFERLLAHIEAGRIDVVVIWEVSRSTRDLEVGARLLALCRARRVLIHVTTHRRTYDPRVARDWRTLAEDFVDAAYESEKTSDRVKRNRKSAAVKGRPHGRVHYGYQRCYDPQTRAFIEQVEHPIEGPIVRAIIADIAAGIPISVVTEDLNSRGIPAPAGPIWHRSTVRSIALNPAYVGVRVHRHDGEDGQPAVEVLDGGWPKIVTDIEHQTVVALLSDPIRMTTRPGRARWLLTYLATCSVCGSHLGARRIRGTTDMYVCGGPRQCVAINVAALDGLVAKTICWRLADPDVYEALMSGSDVEVMAARAEARALRSKLEEFIDSAAAPGGPSAAAVARIEAKLTPLIAAADRRAAAAAIPGALRALLGDGPKGVDELLARFEALDVAQRKAAVRAVATVVVLPAGRAANRPLDRDRVRIDWIDAAE